MKKITITINIGRPFHYHHHYHYDKCRKFPLGSAHRLEDYSELPLVCLPACLTDFCLHISPLTIVHVQNFFPPPGRKDARLGRPIAGIDDEKDALFLTKEY